jgi:uncharacterized protein YrrD
MTMTTKLQFQKGASVLTKNGIEVGTVERVVVHPATNALAGIVVRSGGLLNNDQKVVPAHLVADATEDLVLLQEEAGALESMPPFEEDRLVDANGNSDLTPSAADQQPLVAGAPVMGLPIPAAPGPVIRVEQNIPEGTVALKDGARVITAEGKHVGNVERVLADPSADEVTHLLISNGLLLKEKKLIPMKWVRSLDEEKVHLRVQRDLVENLADASLAV